MDKAKKIGQGTEVQFPDTGKSKRQTLKQAGLSTSVANRFEKIAEIPEEQFEQVIAKSKSGRNFGGSI